MLNSAKGQHIVEPGNQIVDEYQNIMSKFTPDMIKAAHRNWNAAEKIYKSIARDRTTAGYLYGIAAECAIKALFRDLPWTKDKEDGPVYAHFPQLKSKLRDDLDGRMAANLTQFTDQHYMEGWAIAIRYSDGNRPDQETLEHWRSDADKARAELI